MSDMAELFLVTDKKYLRACFFSLPCYNMYKRDERPQKGSIAQPG